MRQRGDGLRLALEPRAAIGIAGEDGGQDLDGDVALEPRVARPVDLAHAARADRRDDLVRAESGAGRHGGHRVTPDTTNNFESSRKYEYT